MPFFTFDQNNSGGYYVGTHYIIIEADNAEEANERAQSEAGIYFDGVSTGDDCPCCGDRWYRVYENADTDVPTVYGEQVIDETNNIKIYYK